MMGITSGSPYISLSDQQAPLSGRSTPPHPPATGPLQPSYTISRNPSRESVNFRPSPYSTSTGPTKTLNIWHWEIGALVVSALAIISIAVVLWRFNNTALPWWSWSGPQVSINAILSVLSTLSRVSLLIPLDDCLGQLMWIRFARRRRTKLIEVEEYGEAGRGIWGCFKLLWRHRGTTLASMGCILTLCSLGLGPATQQLLSYPGRPVVDEESISSVTLATEYTLAGQPILMAPVVAALYAGLDRRRLSPNVTCDSGKCDFPRLETLAVCSQCEWVGEVTPECADGMCRASYAGLDAWRKTDGVPYLTRLNQSDIDPGSSKFLTRFSGGQEGVPWPLATMASIGVGLNRKEKGRVNDIWAMECAMYWCVQQISGRVALGVYAENVTELTSVKPHEQRRDNITSTSSTSSYKALVFTSGNKTNPLDFIVAEDAHKELKAIVSSKLSGWVREGRRNGSTSGDYDGDDNNLPYSSDLMHVLAAYVPAQDVQSTSIDSAFADFATSLTNVIRDNRMYATTSSASTQQLTIAGQTWIVQAFIKANWAWLLYPAAMWVFSASFLFLVVRETRRARKELGVPVFGGSWLAAVLVGVDSEVSAGATDAEGNLVGREMMRKWGEKVSVRFARSKGDGEEDGLRFRMVERGKV